MAFVVGAPREGFSRDRDLHVLTHQGPEGIEHALAGTQAEGLQTVLEQPVEMARQFGKGTVVDHGAGIHIGRAIGKLLNDRVVIAQFDPPDWGFRVVVLVVFRVERVVHAGPDRAPVVELVDAPRLQRLVVDRELDARGGTEQERLATAIGDSFPVVVHFLDAGEIAAGTRTAQQAVDQILGRRPALHVQGKMDGALVGLDVLHGFLGEAVHPFLQDLGCA
ncbi:hypothetical protein D9M70_517740 [compost metagenome]